MTVCIASLTENSKTVVVASDRMITASFLAIQFEHKGSKIYKFSSGQAVALTSGEATRYLEIFRETEKEITGKPDLTVKDITEIVCRQYEKLRNKKIEEQYFRPMGIDRQSFYGQHIRMLPEEIVMGLDELVHKFDLSVWLIIAGVDKSGAHIFSINSPGVSECLDSIGYHSIGAGESHSLLSLIANNVSQVDNLLNTIYHVFEAKKRAENTPGVGKETDMAVISESGIVDLSSADIAILQTTYDNMNKPRRANISKALKKLSVT